jgi:hypothetical protein
VWIAYESCLFCHRALLSKPKCHLPLTTLSSSIGAQRRQEHPRCSAWRTWSIHCVRIICRAQIAARGRRPQYHRPKFTHSRAGDGTHKVVEGATNGPWGRRSHGPQGLDFAGRRQRRDSLALMMMKAQCWGYWSPFFSSTCLVAKP